MNSLPLFLALIPGQWQTQAAGTDADPNFRGLSVVSDKVVWVSGTNGRYRRTVDGGKTWTSGTVAGAVKLDFRDVVAFGESTAYLLSAGPGAESRIYKTTDGGKTWTIQFQNADPDGFFDALAFWDDKHGIALGDPVKGKFQLIATDDGGEHWKALSDAALPPALTKEGAFAASGTCLVTHGDNDVWFATGGAKVGRVFHSADRGRTWTVAETPVAAGVESAGIFSIAFRDREHGIVVGGDYKKEKQTGATAAVTADRGRTWTLVDKAMPYRSAVAWAKDRWIAVGPSGSNVSTDDGKTWKVIDEEKYNSAAFTPSGDGWAAGARGRIVRFQK
jgi:photosystem II stability/assembly factor-like uncharacterized protein